MNEFKNILVPLDGSPFSEAALPYAKAIAARTGARLTLMRATHYAGLLGDIATDQLHAVQEAEDYLDRLVERLKLEGLDAQAGVPFGGSTVAWIIEETDFRHTDLVIMATHDRAGIDRLVHGSVAEMVVHRSNIPVMLVHGTEAEQVASRFSEQQPVFLLPLDGSELAEAAAPVAAEFARVTGGRLVLLGVVPNAGRLIAGQAGAIVTYTTEEVAEMKLTAKAYLEGLAAASQVEIRSGDAATEIAAAAQEYSAAAVVMATHGRTGVIRSLLGSVAGGVVHHTRAPVILVHTRPPAKVQATEQSDEIATAFAY